MTQIKSFVSTKADLLDEKVNKWLEENPNIAFHSIIPYMSYTSIKDKGAYMVGCTIIFRQNLRDKNIDVYRGE